MAKGTEWESRGIDEAIGLLDFIGSFEWTRDPLRRLGLNIVAIEKRYPPARPTSRYRRTGTLGRSWFSQDINHGKSPAVMVANQTPYAGWVQDARTQTNVHQETGWVPIQDAAEKNIPSFVRDIKTEIGKAVSKANQRARR